MQTAATERVCAVPAAEHAHDGVTRILRLVAILGIICMPAIVGRGAIGATAGLQTFAASQHPYFVPAHAILLYFWAPIVAVSACALLLSPGLLLSIALGAAANVNRWIVTGAAASIVVVSVAAAAVQSASGRPLRGGAFVAVVCSCAAACAAIALWRARRIRLAWPFEAGYSGATLAMMAAFPLMLAAVLTPKLYWENFNGDGAHAYESARLLLFHALPFWPPAAGGISSFPGIQSSLFAFPASWFIRLFGEFEFSARAPMLLYLPALFAAIAALIETGRFKRLGIAERVLIWLALIVFMTVMAYSATYNPYCADLAMPGAQDTLLMVCFLGFLLSFIEASLGGIWLFGALTYLSLPSGIQLIGLWLLATLILWRPKPAPQVRITATVLIVFTIAAWMLSFTLAKLGLPGPGDEYSPTELLNRYSYLMFSDWCRVLYLVVPCGILPAIALPVWRAQDHICRALTFVTVAYFASFYIQAFIVLHHFVPCMILPVIVFWRSDVAAAPAMRRILIPAAAVCGVAALFLSAPVSMQPDISGRVFGSEIADRIGGYADGSAEVFRRAEILRYIVPIDWEPVVPAQSFGGSPVVWNYYAQQAAPGAEKHYVIQRASGPPPAGMYLLKQEADTALYAVDGAVVARDRGLRPPTPAASAIYQIPRNLLFREAGPPPGVSIVNLRALSRRWGFDVPAWLKRMGVRR